MSGLEGSDAVLCSRLAVFVLRWCLRMIDRDELPPQGVKGADLSCICRSFVLGRGGL